MKINSLNNVNFTKRLYATCSVKNKENEKHSAKIYEYDPNNKKDLDEILNSDSIPLIKPLFYKEGFKAVPNSRFYAVFDSESNEITACTMISKHLPAWDEDSIPYTSIDEIEENENYVDALTPLIAFLANLERLSGADKIITSYRTDEGTGLKKYSFSKTKNNIWMLPAKRFESAIQRAEKRNNLEIMA